MSRACAICGEVRGTYTRLCGGLMVWRKEYRCKEHKDLNELWIRLLWRFSDIQSFALDEPIDVWRTRSTGEVVRRKLVEVRCEPAATPGHRQATFVTQKGGGRIELLPVWTEFWWDEARTKAVDLMGIFPHQELDSVLEHYLGRPLDEVIRQSPLYERTLDAWLDGSVLVAPYLRQIVTAAETAAAETAAAESAAAESATTESVTAETAAAETTAAETATAETATAETATAETAIAEPLD